MPQGSSAVRTTNGLYLLYQCLTKRATTLRQTSLYCHERAKSYYSCIQLWHEYVPCYTRSTPLLYQTAAEVVGSIYEYEKKMAALNYSVTITVYSTLHNGQPHSNFDQRTLLFCRPE